LGPWQRSLIPIMRDIVKNFSTKIQLFNHFFTWKLEFFHFLLINLAISWVLQLHCFSKVNNHLFWPSSLIDLSHHQVGLNLVFDCLKWNVCLKLSCHRRFQRAFTACSWVFKVFTMVWAISLKIQPHAVNVCLKRSSHRSFTFSN